MKLKVISGVNITESIKNAIYDIPLDEECFVVVPDRMTLQIEEMLFSLKNITATFNVNVVGLTNLAIKHVGVALNPLSQIEGVMQTKKAIENSQSQLKYFKNSNMYFCREIYKFISQLSSSGVSPEDMVFRGKREILKRKFEDVKIIYSEFLNLTSDREDSSKLVDRLAKAVEESKLFENANFYFIGFDSFTAKHYSLMSALCKNVKSIVVSLPMPTNKGNSYIYENDILNKMKNLALQQGCDLDFISPASQLPKAALMLASNLYSNLPKQAEADNVFVFEGKTKKQEAEFVAKTIVYEVYHGARYKDFCIACGDLPLYAPELKLALEKNGVPYYLDAAVTASKTYCALLFKKLITLSYKNFNKNDLLFVANSPFFEMSDKDKQLIANCTQGGARVFYGLENEQIKGFVKVLGDNYLKGARSIVDFMELSLPKLAELDLDEKTLDIENQVPAAIREILDAASAVSNVGEIKEILSAIEMGLETKEISAIPSYCDQVYIGDVAQSFFSNPKKLFVVGANASLMPKTTNDDSIFSDEDIDGAGFAKKIEPSIKMINRRARFKVFSLMCSWTDRLYVCYSLTDAEGKPIAKSSVAQSIIEMFRKDNSIIRSANFDLGDNALLFEIGKNRVTAEQVMSGGALPQQKASLFLALQPNLEKFNRIRPLSTSKELRLGEIIKPTEIEKFYDCPFKVYCENILGLREKRTDVLTPPQRGSIIHDALEKYAKKYSFAHLDNQTMGKFISSELDKVDFENMGDGEIEKIRLKKDLTSILNYVADEYEKSGSQKWLIEENVEGEIAGKKFYGRVDRVDKIRDRFRVIDYKTGAITKNLACDLSYGKKLQLFAYASIIGKTSSLDCGGVYYFEAKANSKNKDKLLVGLQVGGDDKNSVSDEEFKNMTLQAEELMKKACDYMAAGKLFPYPDIKSCSYCPFKAMCLYDAERGVRLLKGGQE